MALAKGEHWCPLQEVCLRRCATLLTLGAETVTNDIMGNILPFDSN
jgi:hypothetical protein